MSLEICHCHPVGAPAIGRQAPSGQREATRSEADPKYDLLEEVCEAAGQVGPLAPNLLIFNWLWGHHLPQTRTAREQKP